MLLSRAVNSISMPFNNNVTQTGLLLTVAILIFHGFNHFYFRIPFQVMAICLLLYPRFLFSTYFWLATTCLSASSLLLTWDTSDNHKYLLFYWVFYIYLVLEFAVENNRERALQKGAAFLLFFTMAGAVIQKTLSDNYLSGLFFEFILLTDGRFTAFAALMTGEDISLLKNNIDTYKNSGVNTYFAEANPPELYTSGKIKALSLWLTWLNYSEQCLIALALLIKLPPKLELFKHFALFVFIIAVYMVAPVIGFGWLICVWGFFIIPKALSQYRVVYIGLFLLLSLYEFPWIKALSASL